MNITTGAIIKSTDGLKGSVFEDAVILIAAHNANGATGFILNKPFVRMLNELQEFSDVRNFPLYNGGPVDNEHLFFIHRRPDIIEGGVPVYGNIFTGGNFTQAVAAINTYTITESDIKIFVGYCGWDDGELETEVEEGSWDTQAAADSIFK